MDRKLWICKDNMQEIAEKLDAHHTLEELGIDEDTVMRMAYQLQYFFEAADLIRKMYPGSRSIRHLNNAVVEK